MERLKSFICFLGQLFSGGRLYSGWILFLAVLSLVGLNAYAYQLSHGLITTGMGDEVSWGLYIANLVFLVGMAAAAVMLIIPAYVFDQKDVAKVTIFAELFAISSIVMCILFVTVDLGRVDRLWHLLPFIGKFHWPSSMLTWDVIVLNGYLFINAFIVGYVLLKLKRGEEVKTSVYASAVLLSILWAPSIHVVTAFLFQGLGGRPFWHTGLVAPRFLASAFSAGPAFILLAFHFISADIPISETVFSKIRNIVAVSLIVNLVMFISEVFSELYMPTAHSENLQLLLGLSHSSVLTVWIWISFLLMLFAVAVYVSPLRKNGLVLNAALVATVLGIWIEKGLGFLIPGFVPSPIGDVVQYIPTFNEVLVVLGIWAFGLLLYTLLVRAVLLKFKQNFV